ncbi:MAG: EscU/YscU/HrcU family type III secretion system export apparatus switch protein, partial [Moraxellaceae bacterium]|nr:EscU/YscU/HrcU family type III secretion system export apparatus switch protein [Moraxellaceae bacterium]
TPFKLEEARKKGQVPRSPELLTFVMVLAFLVVFSGSAYQLASVIHMQAHWWLGQADQIASSWGYLVGQGGASLQPLLYALMPLVAALILMAVITNLVFNGPVFSLAPIKPDFKRLNPIAGFKRMFSRKMFVELMKVLVKGVLFGVVLYAVARAFAPRLLEFAFISPLSLPEMGKSLLIRLGYAVLLVMALAALFDMWYSRKDFGRQMRMSQREVKDEYKRREGDPEIRAKRKRAQQELLHKASSVSKVGDADVVITNPTHYAVALQYRPATMQAPIVLAMGRGFLAQRIMTEARQKGVPILRRPPLARLLHSVAILNAPIPDVTQVDVARVYRWILAIPGNKVLMT